VAVLPSFHYQSSPARPSGRETPYGVELLDRNGGVLHAQRLLLRDPYPGELEWSSDLDGTLGRGHEIFTSGLRAGVHTIRLRASDGQGGESLATVQIEVRGIVFIDHTSLIRSDCPERDAKELGKGETEEKPYDGIQD
jgi:hypothetical protein